MHVQLHLNRLISTPFFLLPLPIEPAYYLYPLPHSNTVSTHHLITPLLTSHVPSFLLLSFFHSPPLPSVFTYLPSTGPAGLVKVQLVTAEVGNGVFISGAMTKVNGQIALVMDIGEWLSFFIFQIFYSHDCTMFQDDMPYCWKCPNFSLQISLVCCILVCSGWVDSGVMIQLHCWNVFLCDLHKSITTL